MGKFHNQFRIASARAAWSDYSEDGAYFITICTANRECIFGEIQNQEMSYSPIGIIIKEEWEKSFEIRNELFCDIWVIMPNHIHAILIIDNVETHDRASLSPPPKNKGIAYRAPQSISSFVAGFKSAATTRINQLRNTPNQKVWQSRFHDHIIRDSGGYERIYAYIFNNIANWNKDRFCE